MVAAGAFSQKITGVVIDAATGDSIPMAGVVYRTHHVMAAADYNGRFSIARHNGWKLYFTAMGYKTKEILVNEKTKNHIVVKLKPDTKQLQEVVVKSKTRQVFTQEQSCRGTHEAGHRCKEEDRP